MKLFAFAAVLLVLVSSCTATAAKPAKAVSHPSVCFSKIESCCFVWKKCGVKKESKRLFGICPVRYCRPVCRKVCTTRRIKGKRYKCVTKVTFKKTCYKHPWEPEICVKRPVYKTVCSKKIFLIKSCRKNCFKYCRVYAKKCYIDKVFAFPKFCPELVCFKPKFEGPSAKPKDIIGKKGIFIKKTKARTYGKAVPHKW